MASSRLEKVGTIYTRVEGLLTRGAMKADDRPIWFDVYRAFPPIAEPKFARPKPTMEIRKIFYPEDQLRAKFHSLGQGLGAVNMLNTSGDTPTKRLLRQYDQLKTDGVPEDELIEQCINAVTDERKQFVATKTAPVINPESVTSQVLAEADIKNIFKEEK